VSGRFVAQLNSLIDARFLCNGDHCEISFPASIFVARKKKKQKSDQH
jgi:hypothetical protein